MKGLILLILAVLLFACVISEYAEAKQRARSIQVSCIIPPRMDLMAESSVSADEPMNISKLYKKANLGYNLRYLMAESTRVSGDKVFSMYAR